MTSASELFDHHRRRFISTDDSSSDLHSRYDTFHHRRHRHRHRHHHRASLFEHGSGRFDESTSQYNIGSIVHAENLSSITNNRTEATRNDRLPGAVLLARERLLQRLRGASVSENRQHIRDPMRVRTDPLSWDVESMFGGFLPISTTTDSDPIFSQKPSKPHGLTQDALNCLTTETFSIMSKCVGVFSRASRECSICLDSFEDGDKLIRLPCDHRFHSACLDPWVRSCGDCPYCRRCIVVVTNLEEGKIT